MSEHVNKYKIGDKVECTKDANPYLKGVGVIASKYNSVMGHNFIYRVNFKDKKGILFYPNELISAKKLTIEELNKSLCLK